MSMIERAKAFAIEAHGDQKRKYTGEPYWHHLDDVAQRVALLTDDEEVIAAAWLHDVIEDTDQDFRAIAEQFGTTVAWVVWDLTDVFTHEAYPNCNRKRRKAEEAERWSGEGVSPSSRLIKLCEVQSNASSIEAEGGQFAEVWRAEKKVLVAALLGGGR